MRLSRRRQQGALLSLRWEWKSNAVFFQWNLRNYVGVVRFIGDANRRIAEDRLRVYRFFRFTASLRR